MPGQFEVPGIAGKLLGFDQIMVRCLDGFTRLYRINGKMKERTWMRVNDVVIVSPWDFHIDKRGNITYRYKPNQVNWLGSSGHLRKDVSILGDR